VLALTNVVHLLAHELARLRGWRLALLLVAMSPLQCLLLRHPVLPAPVDHAPDDAGAE
jgi:hypothetical protein